MLERDKFIVFIVFGVVGTLVFGAWLGVMIASDEDCSSRKKECHISSLDDNGACSFSVVGDNSTLCTVAPCPFEKLDADTKCWLRMKDDPRRCLQTYCDMGFLSDLRIIFAASWGACYGIAISIILKQVFGPR